MRKMILIILLLIAASCYGESLVEVDDLTDEILTHFSLSMEMDLSDVIKVLEPPDWKGFIEGFGAYAYKDFVIFFDNPVGFKKNGGFEDTPNPEIVNIVFLEIMNIESCVSFEIDEKSIISNLGNPFSIESYIGHDLYGSCTNYEYLGDKYIITFSISDGDNKNNYIYIRSPN